MENVVLKYGRTKHKLQFPSNWNEIENNDLIHICDFLNSEINDAELIARLFRGKKKFLYKLPGSYFADAFLPFLNFLQVEPFQRWYLNKICFDNLTLFGPSENFGNILTSEFIFADSYFLKYKETLNFDFVDKAFAVFMREENEHNEHPSADIRKAFNENLIPDQSRKIQSFSPSAKLAFVWNYDIFRSFLEKSFIWVFQKVQEGKKDDRGWEPVLRAMCKGDLTKLDAIANIPVLTFLAELNDTIKQNSK